MGSVELGVALSPESVFYMGSVSKQFTAAAAVVAQEQGYLTLDDKVRPLTKDEFESEEYGTIVFRRDANGQVNGFSVNNVGVRDIGFDKTK